MTVNPAFPSVRRTILRVVGLSSMTRTTWAVMDTTHRWQVGRSPAHIAGWSQRRDAREDGREGAPFARRAAHRHPAAMGFGEPLRECEAQTRALVRLCSAGIELLEF